MPSESVATDTPEAKPTPSAVDLGPNPGTGFRLVWPADSFICPYALLPDPCRPQDVDHNTMRFKFTAPIPSEPSRKAKAFSAIRQQLTEAGVKLLPFEPAFRFPIEAGLSSYLDLKFFSLEYAKLQQNVSLSWEGRKLEWHSSGVPLPNDMFIVLVDGLPPLMNMMRFFNSFRQWFQHDLGILYMWANYCSEAPGEGGFLGQVAFLAGFVQERMGDLWIPGFFNFEGKEYELHFRGRGNACTFCLFARRPRHDVEDCAYRSCSECGQTGHPLRVCPGPRPETTPSKDEPS